MDWDKLRIFNAVAQAGSFTHAGETLSMSQSAVSRQISALESDLKTPLFHRHARGLVLTEAGETLFRTVADVANKLNLAESLLSDSKHLPSGDLKITAPVGFGTVWITQHMREFMDLYPEINIELFLQDEQIDIAMRAADAAVWTTEPNQPELIRRPIMTSKVRAYASSDYVSTYGTPQTIADLDHHKLVSYSGHPAQHLAAVTWLATIGRDDQPPRQAAFCVNSVVAMKYAIRAGLGIGIIPDYLTEQEADLVSVLSEIEPPKLTLYFVYPEELKGSKKVQVLRDFLVAKTRN
ncbi:MAG: LysR family transcriptional regulator [Alphaproteobacteria bacterium]|nr:LysR family transcriptional regulator [Alphaproteobacteria bacterium]